MLKKRLIPVLILKDNVIVQSIGFKRYLPIGKAGIAIEFVARWDVDEIVLLDITAAREGRKPNLALISSVSERCFVPLTVGGGIRTVQDIQDVIHAGADRVSINAAALEDPSFITEGARVFGKQCMLVSIDVRKNAAGACEVYGDSGRRPTGRDPVRWAKDVESLGAGEILLNSIDRDGSKEGYDIELIKSVTGAVSIPVVALGGVGKMEHLIEGVTRGGASAVAAGNIFHYIEHSTIVGKVHLKAAGIDIRLNTDAKYEDFTFDETGRILKRNEQKLQDIWFEKHEVEKI